jgi:hypothetical protein
MSWLKSESGHSLTNAVLFKITLQGKAGSDLLSVTNPPFDNGDLPVPFQQPCETLNRAKMER